ncbi:hypothetical protein GW755_03580 [bacterium]|nr:hypothetical protein [bacterium]
MNKGFFYYLGKFLNFLQNKFPKQYTQFEGNGIKKILLNGLINRYKDFAKNTVTEVKGKKDSAKILEPTVIKE